MASLLKRLSDLFALSSAAPELSNGSVVSVGRSAEIRTTMSPEKVTKHIGPTAVVKGRSEIRKKAHLWKKTQHANLVKCYDVSEYADSFRMTLEHCEGGSLRRFLNTRKCSLAQLKSVAADILAALKCLHSKNIVYKVLKPSHILFKGRSALLADFASAWNEYTLDHYAYYAAPEVLEGKCSPASDLWALGVVLYLASTGKLPFNGIEMEDVQLQIREKQPCWQLLPEELRPLIQGLLKKNPRDRPTAAEALKSLCCNKIR